jgi:hypothetical protein
MQIILSKIEYETLKYFSKFLYLIYPTEDESQNEDLVKNYKKMLYKFVLFLIGYNLDEFNKKIETDKRYNQTIKMEQCISILEFFMFYSENQNEINGMEEKFDFDFNKNNLKGKSEKEFYYELYLKLKDKFDKNKNEDKFFEKKKISYLKKNSVIDKDKDESMLRRKSTTGKITPKFVVD